MLCIAQTGCQSSIGEWQYEICYRCCLPGHLCKSYLTETLVWPIHVRLAQEAKRLREGGPPPEVTAAMERMAAVQDAREPSGENIVEEFVCPITHVTSRTL